MFLMEWFSKIKPWIEITCLGFLIYEMKKCFSLLQLTFSKVCWLILIHFWIEITFSRLPSRDQKCYSILLWKTLSSFEDQFWEIKNVSHFLERFTGMTQQFWRETSLNFELPRQCSMFECGGSCAEKLIIFFVERQFSSSNGSGFIELNWNGRKSRFSVMPFLATIHFKIKMFLPTPWHEWVFFPYGWTVLNSVQAWSGLERFLGMNADPLILNLVC